MSRPFPWHHQFIFWLTKFMVKDAWLGYKYIFISNKRRHDRNLKFETFIVQIKNSDIFSTIVLLMTVTEGSRPATHDTSSTSHTYKCSIWTFQMWYGLLMWYLFDAWHQGPIVCTPFGMQSVRMVGWKQEKASNWIAVWRQWKKKCFPKIRDNNLDIPNGTNFIVNQ